MGEEDKGTFAVQIRCSLQCREQRHQRLSQAGDGPALVDDEISAASEQELRLGELLFTCSKFAEVRAHPCPICDEVGITGIGFRLAPV